MRPSTLNVGCGPIRIPNSLGIDFNPKSVADVIHDLNVYPWPFEDNTFERVVCSHILEHVENPDQALHEIHRIAKPGAVIEIHTPHFTSPDSWADITHRYHFACRAFKPYYEDNGSSALFDLVKLKLGFGRGLLSLGGRIAVLLFGIAFYERHFSFILTARNIALFLKAKK